MTANLVTPSPLEVFETFTASARSAFARIALEIKTIDASPFHNGVSEPLAEIRNTVSAGLVLVQTIEEQIAELKRKANDYVEVAPSGVAEGG